MSQSDSYYDPVYHEEVDFSDSVILQPISLKPSVIPSMLNRSNPQNTILAAYNNIKLTQFIDPLQNGRIVNLVSLEPNSELISFNPEGISFLQRFSGQDIAFVTVVGQKSSGKSFFIDKILNLSNIQGNNFVIDDNKPGINIWSTPYIKNDLKFFFAEVTSCSPGSKQFDLLLPYTTVISSVIVNVQGFQQNSINLRQLQVLDQRLVSFRNVFYSEQKTSTDNKSQVLHNIFPTLVLNLFRKQKSGNANQNILEKSQVRVQNIVLPNAKNQQYRGFDQDLKIHSFLNKKCINQKYIQKVSQIFSKVYSQVQQKKHRQLVFNGGIILKYLRHLSLNFSKAKPIDIGKVYYEIVKDLYISAYNYCVICYHESLQNSLSDEKPRSLDQLLGIFQNASDQIIEKYNEFSLEKSLHDEYQQKLLAHIQSKQRLILEINKKKTDLQLSKIYDQQINLANINQVWAQIARINKNNENYTHGKDITMGRKLSQVILRLKSGNNVDYRIMKQIQKLQVSLKMRTQELTSIKQSNMAIKAQMNQKRKKQEEKRFQLSSLNSELDEKIKKYKKQIKIYSQSDNLDPADMKVQGQYLKQQIIKNDRQIQRLKQQQNEPLTGRKEIVDINRRIQTTKNKIELLESTLKELQVVRKIEENPQKDQEKGEEKKQMKMKRESSNIGQKSQQKKEGSSSAIKQSANLNDTKAIKDSSKVNKKAPQ